MFDSKVFGNNLKALRQGRGLQRQILADMCGISIYTLRSYQSGEIMPSMKAVLNICNALQISPNVLFEGIYKTPTEIDNIAVIENYLNSLQCEKKYRLQRLCEIVEKCMVQGAPNLNNVNIGSRIKILREDIGLTQSVLAERCSVVPGTISCIESNQATPGIEVLLAMCEIFNVSPEFMLCASLEVTVSHIKYFAMTPRQIGCIAEITQFLAQE